MHKDNDTLITHVPIATSVLNERSNTKNYFHASSYAVFFVDLRASFSL